MRSRLFNGRTHDDSGAALAIALVFLLVVGLIITASLTKSGAILTTDLKVRDTTQAQYAADGAIERGLQVLRTQLQSGSTTACKDTTSGTSSDYGDASGFALNGHTAHYSCQTVQGSVGGSDPGQFSNFAIVTTGGSDSLQTQNAASSPVPVDGAVYISGYEHDSVLQKPVEIADGNLDEYDLGSHSACVSSISKDVTQITTVTTGHGKVCTAETPQQALPATTLPALPAGSKTNPAFQDLTVTTGKKKSSTCRVFFPGKYTKQPNLLPDTGGTGVANYFVSGEYYFENIDLDSSGKDTGPWLVDGNTTVIGGQPASGDVSVDPQPKNTACSGLVVDSTGAALSDADALNAVTSALSKLTPAVTMPTVGVWPHGTLFVLGGVSELQVAGSISLYTPPSTAPGTSAPIPSGPAPSFVAVRADKWFTGAAGKDTDAGYLPWSAGSGKTDSAIDTGTAGANMTFNAKVIAPDAKISVFASNPSAAVTRQGLIGKIVSLDASNSVKAGNFVFGVLDHGDSMQPIAERTVVITGCVRISDESTDCTGDAAKNTITEQAVATIDNVGNYAIRVYSWRVLSPPHP